MRDSCIFIVLHDEMTDITYSDFGWRHTGDCGCGRRFKEPHESQRLYHHPPLSLMSYKASGLFPSNPVTTRGASTKISSYKDKVVYTNGKTVIVGTILTIVYWVLMMNDKYQIRDLTVIRFVPLSYPGLMNLRTAWLLLRWLFLAL